MRFFPWKYDRRGKRAQRSGPDRSRSLRLFSVKRNGRWDVAIYTENEKEPKLYSNFDVLQNFIYVFNIFLIYYKFSMNSQLDNCQICSNICLRLPYVWNRFEFWTFGRDV